MVVVCQNCGKRVKKGDRTAKDSYGQEIHYWCNWKQQILMGDD